MRAALSNTMACTSIRVKFGPRESGPSAEVAVGDAVGSLNMERPASNVALLVRKTTAFGGRRGSGRTYWPWGGEGSLLSNSQWSPTFIGIAQTAADTLLSGMEGFDVYPVLLHTPVVIDDVVVELPPTPVDSWSVQAVAATQRRRLRR